MRVRDLVGTMPYLDKVIIGKSTYRPEEIPTILMNAAVESCRAECSRTSFKHDLIVAVKEPKRKEKGSGQMDLTYFMEMGGLIT